MTPEQLQEFASLAHWAIGAFASCAVIVVGAVVWLTTLVFGIGKKYGALEALTAKIDKTHDRIERVPIIETKLDQLALSHAEERRRFASDFPAIVEKVTALWDRSQRASQGQFGE